MGLLTNGAEREAVILEKVLLAMGIQIYMIICQHLNQWMLKKIANGKATKLVLLSDAVNLQYFEMLTCKKNWCYTKISENN